jgi:hypothetical protein
VSLLASISDNRQPPITHLILCHALSASNSVRVGARDCVRRVLFPLRPSDLDLSDPTNCCYPVQWRNIMWYRKCRRKCWMHMLCRRGDALLRGPADLPTEWWRIHLRRQHSDWRIRLCCPRPSTMWQWLYGDRRKLLFGWQLLPIE